MANAWGKFIWLFFHTFAEKINPEFFKINATKCINIIINICYNLPCPICSTHARQYIQKYKIEKTVKTKDDLKQFLYMFHNHTNTLTRKPTADINILNNYKNAIFDNITTAFNKAYINKSLGTRSFTDKMLRIRIANETIQFLKSNYKFFSN